MPARTVVSLSLVSSSVRNVTVVLCWVTGPYLYHLALATFLALGTLPSVVEVALLWICMSPGIWSPVSLAVPHHSLLLRHHPLLSALAALLQAPQLALL